MAALHRFLYSPFVNIPVANVSNLRTRLQNKTNAVKVLVPDAADPEDYVLANPQKIPTTGPFRIRIDPPDYDPDDHLRPKFVKATADVPNPGKSSVLLAVFVFDTDALANVTRTTLRVAGFSRRNPDRRRAGQRQIKQQAFQFDIPLTGAGGAGFTLATANLLVLVHSIHQFVEDDGTGSLTAPKTMIGSKALPHT
jgi:hypothetical protein